MICGTKQFVCNCALQKEARLRQKEKKKQMRKKAKRRTTDDENESQEELDETQDDTVSFLLLNIRHLIV